MKMKVTLGVFALTWLVAGLTHADTIGLYADTQGTQCNIELQPYLTYIHVVHVTDGAMGCKFMAPRPECLTGAIPVGDQCPLEPPACCCGDSQTGNDVRIRVLQEWGNRDPENDLQKGPGYGPLLRVPPAAVPGLTGRAGRGR